MTDEQRQAMIRGMVAALAAKQAADPSNLDGWLRLGRAYAVLHQTDQAADAFDKAAALKPNDISIRVQEVRALLSDHAPTDKLPPRVVDLLKHV
jgi:cytochrome c-type biogenesis protein CcmH